MEKEITNEEIQEVIAFDAEKMADAIQAIADASKAVFNGGRLKYETIVTLIHDTSKIPKSTIRLVLNNLIRFDKHIQKPTKTLSPDSPLNELMTDK